MKELRKFLVYALVGALLCLNVYQCHRAREKPEMGGCGVFTDTLTVIDTIPYYKPVPRDSVVIRYVTEKLPAIPPREDGPTGQGQGNEAEAEQPDSMEVTVPTELDDSVTVQIPITQKRYETDRYRAYVSGYRPSLDSLFIFPERQVVRIREKQRRWHVGVQAGYGVTPKGFQPYLGVGVSYDFLSF